MLVSMFVSDNKKGQGWEMRPPTNVSRPHPPFRGFLLLYKLLDNYNSCHFCFSLFFYASMVDVF